MKYLSLQSVISSEDPIDSVPGTSWLNITQDEVDPRFDVVTTDFLNDLFSTVAVGGDPYDHLEYDCPVTQTVSSNGVFSIYKENVIVNRSKSLEGKYTLSAGNYDISGPISGFRLKSGEILTEKRKVIELGWLPKHDVSITQEYPINKIIDVFQNDGFLYLSSSEYAILHVSGIAEVDIWEMSIKHLRGTIFTDREITVKAEWGIENSAVGVIKIPGCVIDTFNLCPNYNNYPNGIPPIFITGPYYGGGNPGNVWDNIQLNPQGRKICYYNGCTGQKIKCVDTVKG